jgi:hypothetical protein
MDRTRSRPRVIRPSDRSARRGVALLAALALLALAAALVVGTFGAGRAMSRATVAAHAAARADAGARRALAQALAGWESSLDSLPIGAVVARFLSNDDPGAPPLVVSARIRRLRGDVFLIVTEAKVSVGATLVARRRYRLLVERASAGDTTRRVVTPSPLAEWALDETN